MITICGTCKAESVAVVPDLFPSQGWPTLPCGHPDDPRLSAAKTTTGVCGTCGRLARWFAGEPAPRCLSSRDTSLAVDEARWQPRREALRRKLRRDRPWTLGLSWRLDRGIRLWRHWRREWLPGSFCNGKVVEQ